MKYPAFYARVASSLSGFFHLLFGSVSWTSPPWLKKLRGAIRSSFYPSPLRGAAGWAAVIFLLLGSSCLYLIQQRGNYTLVTTQITPPITLRDDLTIEFVSMNGIEFISASAAPIAQFGKPVHAGIKIIPALSGQWQWRGDSKMTFTPEEDWAAGQTYRVVFNRAVFDRNVKMKGYHHTFSTSPLTLEIEELRLYQDHKDPQVQTIVGTLNFNFPVDPNSLIPNIRFLLQEIKNNRLNPSGETIPFTIACDEFNKKAFIKTSPVKLSAIPRYVNLIIDTGIKAAKGSSTHKTATQKKLFIPDFNSLLQIKNAVAVIQRDKEDTPEQVLVLETTIGVNSADLLKYLHASILPNDYPAVPFHPVRKDYEWSKPGEVTPEILSFVNSCKASSSG